MAKASGTQARMIERMLREEGRPMTSREILDKMVLHGYRMLPSTRSMGQILRKSKQFEARGTCTTSDVTVWYIKEVKQ